ncbi:MAG: hypothetical protein ACYCZY_04435 [Lacisediminihabitans sp.]
MNCTSSPSGGVPATFTWASRGATRAAIGVGTTNAFTGKFDDVPTSGTYTLDYQCSDDQQIYTVSIEGPSGQTHHTVKLIRALP